jgi:23S rRNA pseudouridine1911/1915/1917 synthase
MNGQQVELVLQATGERLDKALADVLKELSRTQCQQLISEGRVAVDGLSPKASMRLEGGERVVVTLPELAETGLRPEPIPLDIRYEDEDCIVVNKAAGMVVHPSSGHEHGTLVHAILAHCPDVIGVGGERRPGIVHRLDKGTSGLILVAKNDRALRHLQAQFKTRTVNKGYLALVEGRIQPSTAIIDAPLGRDPRKRKKMSVITSHSARSRPAQTSYSTVSTFEGYTLVACSPHTGRTHQIRVHLAYVGFPIAGDKVYGRRKQRLPLERHFLHAVRLGFRRPADDQELSFEAELPADLQVVLDNLVAVA